MAVHAAQPPARDPFARGSNHQLMLRMPKIISSVCLIAQALHLAELIRGPAKYRNGQPAHDQSSSSAE